ncbi:RHS repeat-associated core domain-containing protein [Arthrobacter bambusae]|uniref:RHS repeat-associated core domain-containing protein n=1 Tax=Arthrobacter bambusae TaxID=1338426 RepID=UPI00277EEDA7|nr:uncharacterized protein RhaS with RHS repeats [Arthrobacter bambusae]MDQ0096715.1 uncharacterized protein RhaS with RHS repeats [Arthrobacter bambusae]
MWRWAGTFTVPVHCSVIDYLLGRLPGAVICFAASTGGVLLPHASTRYYNPYRGRFTQSDPSGQEANRYLYAGANPVSNTDPTGLDLLGTVFAAVLSAPLAAVGATAVCALPGAVGCLVGAALFGAFAGAAIAGANAGTNGATVQQAGQETLYGAFGGAITGFFGKYF